MTAVIRHRPQTMSTKIQSVECVHRHRSQINSQNLRNLFNVQPAVIKVRVLKLQTEPQLIKFINSSSVMY